MREQHEATAAEMTAPDAQAAGPAEIYQERRARFAGERAEYNRRRHQVANVCVVLFFVALGCFIAGFVKYSAPLLAGGIALGVAFVVTFYRQVQLDHLHERYDTLWHINDEGLMRLRRDWERLPLRQPAVSPARHEYAGDLDILGHASLQHLLNTAGTPAGAATLQSWLLDPAAPATARERQPAVAELAPAIAFRDEMTLFGRQMGMTPPAYERFVAWAEDAPWLASRRWLLWVARVLPVIGVILLIAELTGATRYPFWLAIPAINYALTYAYGKRIEALLNRVSEKQVVFQPYAAFFASVGAESFSAPLLRTIQGDLAKGDVNAAVQMRRLGRIMQAADLRLSMFFPVIQAATLWTVHTLWLLEDWQRTAGPYARGWLERLSEMEALAALATLAFDNPDWTFPEIVEGETPLLTARALAHPLLPPEVRVANDVSVGPPGSFLLITGSNMSGKSTLLRAIGMNVILAQAGGPVCAASLRMPPLALATSMRVQDSLERGVSYFMAELQRIKDVVDAAQAAHDAGQFTPLFLLDEILHGTNTTERQIAVRRIIPHLLALGAIGAVSTHDLQLAQAPEIAGVAREAHFTETFHRGEDGPVMRFDYHLRPGIATTTNALKLMEIVGLPVGEP
ncbi:MAG TPA: MutS family DNA mismatch repair protein [Ktedonobacterales bacterium]|nr:MutS family DNA mismatch repair protein [Ktedonobacterales bacterium]